MKPVLLIVDDEESVRESFRMTLQDEYDLIFAENAKTTLSLLKSQTFHLCLLDIMLPDGSGLDLLHQMKRRDPSIDIIMVTALQGVDTALSAMKGEVQDYILKPFQITELRELIRKVLDKRALSQKKKLPKDQTPFPQALCLAGNSLAARGLRVKFEKAAGTDEPVCLMGEKGSGMEAIAREIHGQGRRKKGPFVTMDCFLESEIRLERELFGEEGGKLPQIGKLEFAHQGTIFLKQIHRLPLALQDKLAASLTRKNQYRLGGEVRLPLDVRVITSSDIDLTTPAAESLFLKDFYRLLIHRRTFSVPALRERKEDIPLLMDRILQSAPSGSGAKVKKIHPEVIELLTGYAWPGNLLELENVVEVMVLYADKDTLSLEDIPLDILIQQMDLAQTPQEAKLSLRRVEYQFERKYIRKMLEKTQGNQTRAAQRLGIHRVTLIQKLKKLNLEEDYRKIVQERRERGSFLNP